MHRINFRKGLALLIALFLVFSIGQLWARGLQETEHHEDEEAHHGDDEHDSHEHDNEHHHEGEMVIPHIEPADLGAGESLPVVASNSIIGDVVKQVAGGAATIEVLMPIGQNPHAYEPTPRAMATLEDSYIAFVNGLNLEEALMETIENVAGTYIVPVSAGITVLEGDDHDDHGEHEEGHYGGHAFEWAGAFELSAGEYVWTFAKVDGDYADPMMKMVMLSSGLSGIEAIEEQEEKAEELLESPDSAKRVHGETLSVNDNKAYQVVFDPDKNVTEFRIAIEKEGVYTFFTEHMPFEFEADEHFLKNLDRDDIEPIAQEPDTGHDHHHAGGDPHFWLDPNNVIVWTQNIAEVLSEADPANNSTYEANADAYIAELEALDIEIRRQVSSIPRNRRKLIEDHVALTYYADEYGFEIIGQVIPSVSDQAEPSARHIAELADVIREEEAYVILIGGEVGRGMRNLANTVADEVGRDVQIVEYLHGSLAPEGSRGDTYLDLIRFNTEQIVSALKQ